MTATVTAGCVGGASWKIVAEPQGNSVAASSTSCPCSSTTLFTYRAGTAPLTKGTYKVEVGFSGKQGTDASASETITVTDSQAAGQVAAVSLTLVALAALAGRWAMEEPDKERKAPAGSRSPRSRRP